MNRSKKILIVGCVAFLIAQEEENQRRMRRQHWVNPYLKERNKKSRFYMDFENMTQRPSVFHENFHMSEKNFCTLFGLVEQYLVPKRNTRPDAIPINAKLAIVLEFLASGDLQRHVCSAYRISKQHFGVAMHCSVK